MGKFNFTFDSVEVAKPATQPASGEGRGKESKLATLTPADTTPTAPDPLDDALSTFDIRERDSLDDALDTLDVSEGEPDPMNILSGSSPPPPTSNSAPATPSSAPPPTSRIPAHTVDATSLDDLEWDEAMADLDTLDNLRKDDPAWNTTLPATAQLTQEDMTDLQKGISYLEQLLESKAQLHELEQAIVQLNKLIQADPQSCLGLTDAQIGKYVLACGQVNPPPQTKAEKAKGRAKRGTAIGKISFGSLDDIEL